MVGEKSFFFFLKRSNLITYSTKLKEDPLMCEFFSVNLTNLQILGLDVCRDTIVGDEMIRGISGGQKNINATHQVISLMLCC